MGWIYFLLIWVALVTLSFATFKKTISFPKTGLKKFFCIFGILAIGPILFIMFLVCSAGKFLFESLLKAREEPLG